MMRQDDGFASFDLTAAWFESVIGRGTSTTQSKKAHLSTSKTHPESATNGCWLQNSSATNSTQIIQQQQL